MPEEVQNPPIQTWTVFSDSNSGGDRKSQWRRIYIQAPESEAVSIFYAIMGTNPYRVTCTCCGPDYSVVEETDTLEQITGFYRNCFYDEQEGRYREMQDTSYNISRRPYKTLFDYMSDPEARFIGEKDIKDEHRNIDVPRQGYVWVGE